MDLHAGRVSATTASRRGANQEEHPTLGITPNRGALPEKCGLNHERKEHANTYMHTLTDRQTDRQMHTPHSPHLSLRYIYVRMKKSLLKVQTVVPTSEAHDGVISLTSG